MVDEPQKHQNKHIVTQIHDASVAK